MLVRFILTNRRPTKLYRTKWILDFHFILHNMIRFSLFIKPRTQLHTHCFGLIVKIMEENSRIPFFSQFVHSICVCYIWFLGGRLSNENSNSYALSKGDHPSSPPPPPPPPAPLQPQYTREIPSDLTKEDLIKEAQRVIAQTERIKCTVDTPNSLAGIRTQEGKLRTPHYR